MQNPPGRPSRRLELLRQAASALEERDKESPFWGVRELAQALGESSHSTLNRALLDLAHDPRLEEEVPELRYAPGWGAYLARREEEALDRILEEVERFSWAAPPEGRVLMYLPRSPWRDDATRCQACGKRRSLGARRIHGTRPEDDVVERREVLDHLFCEECWAKDEIRVGGQVVMRRYRVGP